MACIMFIVVIWVSLPGLGSAYRLISTSAVSVQITETRHPFSLCFHPSGEQHLRTLAGQAT
jgi:hypothetical protein